MGVRDIIAHHYFDVDIDVIYQIIHDDLTPLLEAIRFFIKEISEICFDADLQLIVDMAKPTNQLSKIAGYIFQKR